MAKVKYRFNPNNLTYEKYHPHFWEKFLRIFGFLSTSILFSFIIVFILFYFFQSPKEKHLERKLEQYSMQYEMMNPEPIPKNVRDAGFGGIERYDHLKHHNNKKVVENAANQIEVLSKELSVLNDSYNELAKLANNKKEMLNSIPAIQPVKNNDLNKIASGFGNRVHPIYKTKKFHSGLDFTASPGTKVFATGEGKVVEAEYSRRGYGNRLVIQHGYGYKTMYCHLKKFHVEEGEKIKRGELVAEVGNTGLSTGPHLHYEVIKNSKAIDPINFFHNDLTPKEY
ncbi:MAG: peptidase M23, partial [Bacteroidetes bacterium SW_10_40_5]